MYRVRWPLLALSMVAFAQIAEAGPIADRAAEIETAVESGDIQSVDAALDAIILDVLKSLPFGASKTLFASGPVTDFGIYDERLTSIFKSGEPMFVYAELYGYDLREADGRYALDMAVSFRLFDETGTALIGAQDDFQLIKVATVRPTRDMYLALEYTFQNMPPGDYQLMTIVDDQISGEQATFVQPFTISP